MSKEIAKKFLDTPSAVKRYLDSSVSGNIAHSLRCTDNVTSFSELSKYSEKDLCIIITKLVELYNGSLDFNFLNKEDFKVSINAPITDAIKKARDISQKKLYKDLDRKALASEYKKAINLSCKLEKQATEDLVTQLSDVLIHLDFMSLFEKRTYNEVNGVWLSTNDVEYYIIQPAIKYALLKEAKNVLLESDVLSDLSEADRLWLAKQIDNDIMGRMSENIVIFEVSKILSKDKYTICKPYFEIEGKKQGEYDMLIYDKETNEYYAFEIKHSSEIYSEYDGEIYKGQDKNLLNDKFEKIISQKFGKKAGAFVLYNGEPSTNIRGTCYLNITEFLLKLSKQKDIRKVVAELLASCMVKKAATSDSNAKVFGSKNEKNLKHLETAGDSLKDILPSTSDFLTESKESKQGKSPDDDV